MKRFFQIAKLHAMNYWFMFRFHLSMICMGLRMRDLSIKLLPPASELTRLHEYANEVMFPKENK